MSTTLLLLSALALANVHDDGGHTGGMASGGNGYAPNRAVVVELIGRGPGFDNAAYAKITSLIADGVANESLGVVKELELAQQSAVGYCLELAPEAPLSDLVTLRRELDAITPTIGTIHVTYALSCDD